MKFFYISKGYIEKLIYSYIKFVIFLSNISVLVSLQLRLEGDGKFGGRKSGLSGCTRRESVALATPCVSCDAREMTGANYHGEAV